MLPANQGFQPDHTVGDHTYLWLVENPQLIPVKCGPKVPLQAQAVSGIDAHGWAIEPVSVLAPCLDVIHGNMGVLDQLIQRLSGFMEDGDTDTDANEHFMAVQLERFVECLDKFPGNPASVFMVIDGWQQQGEFVTTKPGQGVSLAQALFQTGGNCLQ